jgi:ribosome-associated heat shock protein Hsp15
VNPPGEGARIDHWLKLVCLFKHRSDAMEACRGGLVKINGARIKPASTVKQDDVVEITAPHYRRVIALDLPKGPISKEAARTLYYRDETPPEEKSVLSTVSRDRGAGRPTKKQRREIEKWRKS